MRFINFLAVIAFSVPVISCSTKTVKQGEVVALKGDYTNFEMSALVKCDSTANAAIAFHTDDSGKGYDVVIANGVVDGAIRTGSLKNVRNLYKSTAKDSEWFALNIAVRGKNITVAVDSVPVVNYTEPDQPYRSEEYNSMLLSDGKIMLKGYAGKVEFKDVKVTALPDDARNEAALPVVDEQSDAIIRLQQRGFPVIDYHVHLKGWDKEQAHTASMNYGINYGIAPNCGIGFPITSDAEVINYCDSTQSMPFMFGMQGEGREWPQTFSKESRDRFDYVFTDAMTYTDTKGRRTRMWIDEEVFIDIPQEEYMDMIVDRIVKVLNEEPIDIYVNPCTVPTAMQADYDKLWTPKRIARVVDALKERNIALEINARYRVPNFATIREAKAAGIKLAFGTNNGTPDIGKLEYCIEAIDSCALTAADLWFPSQRSVTK